MVREEPDVDHHRIGVGEYVMPSASWDDKSVTSLEYEQLPWQLAVAVWSDVRALAGGATTKRASC